MKKNAFVSCFIHLSLIVLSLILMGVNEIITESLSYMLKYAFVFYSVGCFGLASVCLLFFFFQSPKYFVVS